MGIITNSLTRALGRLFRNCRRSDLQTLGGVRVHRRSVHPAQVLASIATFLIGVSIVLFASPPPTPSSDTVSVLSFLSPDSSDGIVNSERLLIP
jgi:hypothetical protein